VVTQAGVTKTKREAPVVAVGRFMIEQQRQPFGMAQALGFIIAGKVGKRPCHAGQAELTQQIKGWMFQHFRSFQW
jgi:hypothetical protein